MNNRAFSKIALIIIFVILAGGGILAWQFLKTPKEEIKKQENIVADETANWKVYQNDEYDYEIKYPENWYLTVWPKKDHIGFRTYSDNVEPTLNDSLITIEVESGYASAQKWIDEYKSTVEPTLATLGPAGSIKFFQDNVLVGSEQGYKIGFVGKDGDTTVTFFVSIISYRNGNVFILNQASPTNCQSLDCQTFNQMLSTFKFTSKQTSDQKKKALDSETEATMRQIQDLGVIYYNKNKSYQNFGSDSEVSKLMQQMMGNTGNWSGSINSPDAYCSSILLSDGKTRFCIDSFGTNGENLKCDENQIRCTSQATTSCIDTDGYKNFDTKGKAYGRFQDEKGNIILDWWEDYCVGSNGAVYDFTCRTNVFPDSDPLDVYADSYTCPNGCQDGVCK